VFILDPPLPPSLSVHGARPCVSFLTTPENQPPAAFSACACHHRTESESLYSYSYRGVTTLACTPQPPRLCLFLALSVTPTTALQCHANKFRSTTHVPSDPEVYRPSVTHAYATQVRNSGKVRPATPHGQGLDRAQNRSGGGAPGRHTALRFLPHQKTKRTSTAFFSAWCLPPSLGVALQLQGIKTLACTPQPPRLSSSFFSLALTSRNGIFSRLRCGTMLKQSALLCLCSRSCYPTRTRHERGPRAAAACFVQFHGEFSHLLLSVSAACPCSRQTTDPSLMTEK
jgi:hypothetical protein